MADMTQTTTMNRAMVLGDNPLGDASLRQGAFIRHLAVMLGVVASVALGVAVVLWSQEPNYAPLYGSLAEQDSSQIVQALQQTGADFKLDQTTGAVLVPSSKLQELRMQLASQGLPSSDGLGFEMLKQDTGFGTSRMVENARYHHALENELARTISTISAIKTARVHLALPKQSVFVRKRQEPSASVTLQLFAGRVLDRAQVESIVHLVSASVPELKPSRVTVVDQKGNLLSEQQDNSQLKLSASQFEYTRKVEEHFRGRVEDLLAPILGADAVRAQVTAEVDFTVTEKTQERYNPDQPALRSEQLSEEVGGASGPQGVPGALTNQPPAAGSAPQVAAGVNQGGAGSANPSSRQSTRNYELDRVISHTRMSPAELRRLSVAVVVDDRVTANAEGMAVRQPRSPEEIERISQLVREAIGFNAQRGDSVKVVNSSFQAPAPIDPLPEVAMWEEPWFWDIVKQAVGVLIAVVVIFGVIKPTVTSLLIPKKSAQELAAEAEARGEGGAGEEGLGVGAQGVLTRGGEPVELPGPGGYENVLDAARKLVDEDPKRVAQLVKTWMAE